MTAVPDNLALARSAILAPGGLDEQGLDRTLGLVMDHAIDAADLYFQVSREESWALEDGIVKEGSASIEEGVGVRAISGEKTGFAYSDEILPAALEEASRAARAIAKQTPGRGVQAWHRIDTPLLYQPTDPLTSMDDATLRDTGVERPLLEQVIALARMAESAGLAGVVASAHETPSIRAACGPGFVIVTPGIRGASAGADHHDQARTMGPAEAIHAGATYIVVGRPIIGATDPRVAAEAIVREIE